MTTSLTNRPKKMFKYQLIRYKLIKMKRLWANKKILMRLMLSLSNLNSGSLKFSYKILINNSMNKFLFKKLL